MKYNQHQTNLNFYDLSLKPESKMRLNAIVNMDFTIEDEVSCAIS